MSEKIGNRKVVWKDGDFTKVVRGDTIIDDFFIKVTPFGQETIWINKDAVVVIKDN